MIILGLPLGCDRNLSEDAMLQFPGIFIVGCERCVGCDRTLAAGLDKEQTLNKKSLMEIQSIRTMT